MACPDYAAAIRTAEILVDTQTGDNDSLANLARAYSEMRKSLARVVEIADNTAPAALPWKLGKFADRILPMVVHSDAG